MKSLWNCKKWQKRYKDADITLQPGLKLRFEKGVDPCLRAYCLQFGQWLRREYVFPVGITVSVKKAARIRAIDGDLICGSCWKPDCKYKMPYIKIASGDYHELLAQRGEVPAIAEILLAIAHELTHYFQWLNGVELTPLGEERQANRYADLIVCDYYEAYGGFPKGDGYLAVANSQERDSTIISGDGCVCL